MDIKKFEEDLHHDLHEYFKGKKELDERFAECPDVEEKWEAIANAYLADGMREFANYPTASLGWMMFIGMALAQYWDTEWEIYDQVPDLYVYMRDKRDFDHLDEYICEEVLHLEKDQQRATSEMISECAARVLNILQHADIQPGTKEAFQGYVACIHQMYLMGMGIQLHRLGYHMTRL